MCEALLPQYFNKIYAAHTITILVHRPKLYMTPFPDPPWITLSPLPVRRLSRSSFPFVALQECNILAYRQKVADPPLSLSLCPPIWDKPIHGPGVRFVLSFFGIRLFILTFG